PAGRLARGAALAEEQDLLRSEAPKPVGRWPVGTDGGPLVAFAATVQFAAGEESAYPHVESRMLLAVEAGRGVVEGDGAVLGLWVTEEQRHPSLRTVARLAAQVWDRGTPTLEAARALGVLVVDALDAATPVSPHDDHALPIALRRALAWISAEPGRTVTLEQL